MKWWRCTRVLFWKNWRIKQRQSWLNKRFPRVQLPPLVADIIVPLTLLLYLIHALCSFNAASVNGGPNGANGMSFSAALADGGGGIASVLGNILNQDVKTDVVVTSELLMTSLPFLLQKADYQFILTKSEESARFLAYLDAKYPSSEHLGMPSYLQMASIVSSTEAQMLISSPKYQNKPVYAVLDVTHAAATGKSKTFQLTLTMEKPPDQMQNQVEQVLFKHVVLDATNTPLTFPNQLAFQVEMDAFVRHESNATRHRDEQTNRVDPSSARFAKQACQAMSQLLESSRLKWEWLNAGTVLGNNQQECELKVPNLITAPGQDDVRAFLVALVQKLVKPREFQLDGVSKLANKPVKTSSGMMESNIVWYMAYLLVWPFTRLVCDIVTEKESQLKEYLLIMGVPSMTLLLSWFVLYLYAITVVDLVGVYLLSNSMFDATSWSSPANFFLVLMSFSLSILCFGMAITPVFSHAKTAATGAPLLLMVLGAASYLRGLIDPDTLDSYFWLGLLVETVEQSSSPVVFMKAIRGIMRFDEPGDKRQPVTFDKVFEPSIQMLLQTLAYIVLGWYLEKVFPRTFGVQYPWYFLFQKSYWFPRHSKDESVQECSDLVLQGTSSSYGSDEDCVVREIPFDEHFVRYHPVVLVRKLWKTYDDGTIAVRNVSFGVKKGEIFGLLGTNGAGKSTTMSILCGMLQPSQGDAFVGAHSVTNNPNAIRKSLSVCFQQNILFNELSVEEHLALVCALKSILGVHTTPRNKWDELLRQFGLLEKQTARADTLSGGQKRKLSLVLALLDDSKLLLLDEPTAGMDLKARYDTWAALKSAVRTRAVILTTHMMQEADALCGSIGIMSEGLLKCCGTSLFLRETFGVGYKLRVVLQSPEMMPSKSSPVPVTSKQVLEIVRSVVDGAVCLSDNKWETRLRLPAGHEHVLAVLFEKLDALKKAKTICGYSIAATDLEDVFVRVTQGDDVSFDDNSARVDDHDEQPTKVKQDKANKLSMPYDEAQVTNQSRIQASNYERCASQLRTLLLKRCKTTARDRKALLSQYGWPFALFLFLAFMSMSTNEPTSKRFGVPLTQLSKPLAREACLFVASDQQDDQTASFAQFLSTQMSSSRVYKSKVFVKDLTTSNQTFEQAILQQPEAMYAAIHLRKLDLSIPSIDMELQYNASIPASLAATARQVAEAYCRAIQAFKHRTFTSSPHVMLSRVLSDHDRGMEIPASDTELYKDECHLVADLQPFESAGSASLNMIQNFAIHLVTAYNLLFLLSSVTALYVVSVVKERETGLQRFQYLHGVQSVAYWLAFLVFDVTCFVLCCCVAGTVIFFVGRSEIMISLVGLCLCFALAAIPFVYFCSQLFGSSTSAQAVMSYVNLIQIVLISLDFAFALVPGLCAYVMQYGAVFQLLPLFTFGRTVMYLSTREWHAQRELCVQYSSAAADGDEDAQMKLRESFSDMFGGQQNGAVEGMNHLVVETCVWLIFLGCMYFCVVLAIDLYRMYPRHFLAQIRYWMPWCSRKQPSRRQYQSLNNNNNSAASANESSEVEADGSSFGSKLLQVQHLTKIYDAKGCIRLPSTKANHGSTSSGSQAFRHSKDQVVAVDDLSFVVETNENVALLGMNGSGKSTTFEILSASLEPTEGQVLVEGHDVTTCEPEWITNSMAYCPQKNVFFENLTVYEHIELVTRLRQSRWKSSRRRSSHHPTWRLQQDKIHKLICALDLTKVQHVAAKKLSGGTKRRLMLALTVVCDDVPLLLLDEPSAGVDVVARRLMWRALQQKRANGKPRGCLFTTHSMEEAEAVCANAVVLRKGKRVWWGSIQSLKQKVATGICISVRLDYEACATSNKVTLLMDQVLHSLNLPRDQSPREETTIAHTQLMQAWETCCRVGDRMGQQRLSVQQQDEEDAITSIPTSDTRSTRWIDKYFNESEGKETINLSDFVTEWLVQDQMERIHTALTKRVTQLGGSDVVFAEQNGVARGVFETSCNAQFGLSQVFTLMEQLRVTFGIVQYLVSEMSLERVFEQFTHDDDDDDA